MFGWFGKKSSSRQPTRERLTGAAFFDAIAASLQRWHSEMRKEGYILEIELGPSQPSLWTNGSCRECPVCVWLVLGSDKHIVKRFRMMEGGYLDFDLEFIKPENWESIARPSGPYFSGSSLSVEDPYDYTTWIKTQSHNRAFIRFQAAMNPCINRACDELRKHEQEKNL